MPEQTLGPAHSRIADRARGLRTLSNVLEFIGWLGVFSSVVLAFVLASQETTTFTTDFSGDLDLETTKDVPGAIALGTALAIGCLAEVAIARGIGLFAEYAAARTGTDLDGLAGGGVGPSRAGGPTPSWGEPVDAQTVREWYPKEYQQATEQLSRMDTQPTHVDEWISEFIRRVKAGSPPAAAAEKIPLDWPQSRPTPEPEKRRPVI